MGIQDAISSKMPRVVLADDHEEVLEQTRSLLESDFEIVFLAHNGNALVSAVAESRPDIVVTDVRMPGRTGIEAGREIIRRNLCSAVVVLSLYKDSGLVKSALDSGIRGYVLKDEAGEELVPALNTVLTGGRYLSRGVAGFGW